jgi:hypothetical protein
MSSIPTNANIAGSIAQTQISAAETAKKENVRRNQRTRDSKELTRLAEQKQDEVENTEQTDGVVVHRQDERQRDGQDAHDTYDRHDKNVSDKLYNTEGRIIDSDGNPVVDDQDAIPDADEPAPGTHIDLSA